jgi:hypothetical protein
MGLRIFTTIVPPQINTVLRGVKLFRMIDPEDNHSWPALDFLAKPWEPGKKMDDDDTPQPSVPPTPAPPAVTESPPSSEPMQQATTVQSKATTRSNDIPPAPTATHPPVQPTPSSLPSSTSTTIADTALHDIAPKPTNLDLNVKVQSKAPTATHPPVQSPTPAPAPEKGPAHNSTNKTEPKTHSPSINSSRANSRTSSISHAEWCKQHSPRRSTLKTFMSAAQLKKNSSQGIAFIPGKYEGKREGYVHRSSLLGMGYYLETDEVRSVRQNETGGNHDTAQLHPSLMAMGLSLHDMNLRNGPLGPVFEDESEYSDTDASTRQSKRDLHERVLETQQAVHTLSPAYRKQFGGGVWGAEDADWLTRRLAEQYKREQIGHGETLAANVHQSPTTRGRNNLWNTLEKRDQNNVSYYERLHETMYSGSAGKDGSIAGSWLEVLESKSLKKFLPVESDVDTDSERSESHNAPSRPKQRDLGFETDWLRTPTHGVTGKQEYKKYNTKHLSSRQQEQSALKKQNAINLFHALRHDTASPKYAQDYVTHKTGMARACKGSNSKWNTQEPKSSKKKVNRQMRNPIPIRLQQGLARNRKIISKFNEEKSSRQSPQQRYENIGY